VYEICPEFLACARALFRRIQEFTLDYASGEPIAEIRRLGAQAWHALPALFREILSSSFAGDVLISASGYWAAFPWEALYRDDSECGWLGLHRVLPRWAPITAAGLCRLEGSTFGRGWKVGAVICPWNAVAHKPLESARDEADRVCAALTKLGYTLVGGGPISGPAATKQALSDALSRQPSIIHFTGHSEVHDKQEMLILSGRTGGGYARYGIADLRHDKELRKSETGLLFYGPLVVLNSCYMGRTRRYGGRSEDLASELMEEGAAAVIASPLPVYDPMGELFGSSLYPGEMKTMAENFLASRRAVEAHFANTKPNVWPLWTLLHYYGNPYASLP
jgi:hypothetical protein